MKKIKFDILGGTFSNLHITNKKSNIATIVEEMDKKEKHDIKLITSSPRDDFIRMRHLRKKFKNNAKAKSKVSELIQQGNSLPLIEKKNKSKKLRSKLLLIGKEENNKRVLTKREAFFDRLSKKHFNINLQDSPFNESNSQHDYKKIINDQNKFLQSYQNKNEKISIFDSPSKNIFNYWKNKQTKNNIDTLKRNVLSKDSIKKDTNEKYYQTTNLFAKTTPFSRTMNSKRKTTNLLKTKSVTEVKKIPRLKISENYLSEIEQNLNKVYESNKQDSIEKSKIINIFKKKYIDICEKNKKSYNETIYKMDKEINSQLLSLNFQDFYCYLLTILKNYDKHIVDWKFEIEKEKKQCPDELRLKNVKIKHKKFMGKLNKIYDFGLKTNKFMDDLLQNSKKKAMVFTYNQNADNNIIHDLINKKAIQDGFIDKIFEKNQIYQKENNIINNET